MLNGLVAIPIVLLVLRICNDQRIMGARTNGPISNVLGWATLAIIATVGAAAIWAMARGA